jgi:hypothetical protein
MQFDGAVIREQGVTFAVVIVRKHVVDSQAEARDAIAGFAPAFGGIPVVLMAQDAHGRPEYYGRTDLARFMASVPLAAVPWKRYSLN